MAKEFKDFTFMGKKLSDLSVKYVSVRLFVMQFFIAVSYRK